MTDTNLLQIALGGPVLAAIAWLSLSRLPWIRRPVAGVLALGSHAAGWAVFWAIYQGEVVAWRSFTPGLLGATVLVLAEIAILLAAVRADPLPEGANAPVIAGLAVSTSAVAAIAYAGSLTVVALVLALPTVAAAGAALSGRGRQDARGLIGLALADALALVGLSLVYANTGSVSIGAAGGAGPGVLLVAAMIKAGAIPGIGTWRLSATDGPGAWLDVALRAQAVALAAMAALVMRGAAPAAPLAIAATVGVLLSGGLAMRSRTIGTSLAGVSGAASGVIFFALGLGGAVGARAFFLLFPALFIGSGLVSFLARPETGEVAKAKPSLAGPWGWLSTLALGVALGSLAGVPPGGGFPGTWLAISLSLSRSGLSLGWLLAAGAVGIGLIVAFVAAVSMIRAARPRAIEATVGTAVALVLLYLGTEPVRIAIGWWVRVETALAAPEVLPSAGAPGLPAIGGMNLLLALAPAMVLVAVAVGLGRGVRDVSVEFVSPAGEAGAWRVPARMRKVLAPVGAAARPLKEYASRARALGAGFGVAAVLELAAVLMIARIVLLSARAGFL